jgi:hypothetical protein
MAPYASSPPRQSMGTSSPAPQLQPSAYGPTPGSMYSPASGSPFGPPSSSPFAPTPSQGPTHTPTQQDSTYGTPSEYPNPFSSPLPRPPTLPSLSSVPPPVLSPSPSSPTNTGRTISAGAFRRNVSRSDTLDPSGSSGTPAPVTPLSVRKKTLGGIDDTSRGPSPSPSLGSPGAPPTYSAIDEGSVISMRTTFGTGGGFVAPGESKLPPRTE